LLTVLLRKWSARPAPFFLSLVNIEQSQPPPSA
jgi:hypothetical protein